MSQQARHLYEFGPFRLDAAERLLVRDGQPMPLTNKAFDTLLVLVENSGHIVEKDDLMQRVWPDTVVEESTLAQNVFRLRRALGEDTSTQQYIETIPKHGYRFVAPVRELHSGRTALILERHTRSRIVTEEEDETGALTLAEQVVALRASREKDRLSGLRLIPILSVLLVLLVGVSAALFYFRTAKMKQAGTAKTIRSIAVLPFLPLEASSRDESLEMGVAETLITRLSSLSDVTVRPINAVRNYTALDTDPMAAGNQLQVEAVLYGHIQRSGDQIRITVHFLRVTDGTELWAATLDDAYASIFEMQDSISERVVSGLALKLSGEERQRLTRHYTENADAYQAYLKGRFWWNKRYEQGFHKAIDYFNQAIALDPGYALPYAGLADCYAIMSPYNLLKPEESYAKAKAAVTKALEIDDRLAEARTSLAHITWMYDWDWLAAETEFRRAIELKPNYPTAHQWYSVYLSAMARHDEAIAEAKRAYELDPLSLPIIRDLARAYYHARQYDEAIAAYMKAFELDPRYYRYNSWLEFAYLQKGSYDQAVEVYLKAMNVLGANPKEVAILETAYRVAGWQGYSRKRLELMKEHAGHFYVLPYNLARTSVLAGETGQAFEWLEQAYSEHSDHLVLLKVDPIFDSLRSDARYASLMRRVGL